jgi:FtsP/CotA-like multicopper oxidase with cupredoxin domain
MYPTSNFSTLNKYLTIAALMLGLGLVGVLVWSIGVRQSTGLLKITSFSSDATISISQNNKTAAIIGKGNTSVRLQPGSYEVAAISPEKFSSHQVTVSKNQTVSLHLTNTKPPVPSVEDVNWNGINLFYTYGLDQAQIDNMEVLFFKYKPTVDSVTFDESSVTNGFRDLNNEEAPFTLNFVGKIDGKAYKATISYMPNDLNDIDLTLSDPASGAQWYHASSIQPVPNS